MGGDQLLPTLAGDEVEARIGDEARERQGKEVDALLDEIAPLPGARDLLVAIKERGHRLVLASSGQERHVEFALDLLDARDLADDWTTSADVESTKPAPDLVEAAREKAGGGDAVMVGDTPWDVEAAARADVETIAVVTGGFAEAELTEAGACAVFESVEELRQRLEETPLGAAG